MDRWKSSKEDSWTLDQIIGLDPIVSKDYQKHKGILMESLDEILGLNAGKYKYFELAETKTKNYKHQAWCACFKSEVAENSDCFEYNEENGYKPWYSEE